MDTMTIIGLQISFWSIADKARSPYFGQNRTHCHCSEQPFNRYLCLLFLIVGLVGYYDSDASKSDDDSDSDNEQDTEQQRASDVDSDTEIMVNSA